MDRVLIFAGTTEGRELAEYLNRHEVETHVCVATEYGEKLLINGAFLQVHRGRLDAEEMKHLMKEQGISLVIDGTHPYAAAVSANIRCACTECRIAYQRLLRKASGEDDSSIYVASVEKAVEYLSGTKGNIFVSTGSKELEKFTALPDFRERVYARVLSTGEAAAQCSAMGLEGRHLICMQGPFGEALNREMMKHVEAAYLVTKESGRQGGFAEKIRAARAAGVKAIVIGRPADVEGTDEREIKRCLSKRLGFPPKRKISLVGIGMGHADSMTIEAMHRCREADVLIGASRMLEHVRSLGKPMHNSYQPEDIKDYIEGHPEYEKITILLSGDVGFYSGAKKLYEVFTEEELHTCCGISAVTYLCGKLHTSWEDVKLMSAHGKSQNLVGAVKRYHKVFALIGRKGGVRELCEKLIYFGLGHVSISAGENLSYEEERIVTGTPKELLATEFDQLVSVLIRNREPVQQVTHGLEDEEFLRAKVPMTKSEVRSISLSKLGLSWHSVVYDVGAGTGSVSIELSLQSWQGWVYAIEKKAEAVELIKKNQKKFQVDNLTVVEGLAPEAMESLPVPTHVFIGGTSGNLKEIMESVLQKNPSVRIVINAIALETVAEAMACIKNLEVKDTDIAAISVGKAKEVGPYHMMMGQNPVFIISCTGNGKGRKRQKL